MFSRVSDYCQAIHDNTDVWLSFIHKTTCPDGNAQDWIDSSMAGGTPKYNAYVGDQLAFTPMAGGGNNGIYAGEDAPGKTKRLHSWWMHTMNAYNVPGTVMLLDYLGFYPLVDMDDTEIQEFDNTLSLTRYTDGVGVKLMLVGTVPQALSSCQITLSYTNEQGVSGRTVNTNYSYAQGFTGGIASRNGYDSTNARGPFLRINDLGVRSVQSFQLAAAAGGFAALVLVKPIAIMTLLEAYTVTEVEYYRETSRLPEIKDGAYLNFIWTSGSSIGSYVWRGGITIVRS